jgi:hypothetical protein
VGTRRVQVCQIFLGTWYQNRENVPNGHKMYQMDTKCTKWAYNFPNTRKIFQLALKYINIFPSRALQNLPKFLVCKETIWQPWTRLRRKLFTFYKKIIIHPPSTRKCVQDSWRCDIQNFLYQGFFYIPERLNFLHSSRKKTLATLYSCHPQRFCIPRSSVHISLRDTSAGS